MKKNKRMRREHWKKKIYDQEDIFDFLLPPHPEITVYIPNKKTAGS